MFIALLVGLLVGLFIGLFVGLFVALFMAMPADRLDAATASGPTATLPAKVAPSATIIAAATTSPVTRADDVSWRRSVARTSPSYWPSMRTVAARTLALVCDWAANLSSPGPSAVMEPSTVPWMSAPPERVSSPLNRAPAPMTVWFVWLVWFCSAMVNSRDRRKVPAFEGYRMTNASGVKTEDNRQRHSHAPCDRGGCAADRPCFVNRRR